MLEFKRLNIEDIERIKPFYSACLKKQYYDDYDCGCGENGECNCSEDCDFRINRTNDCTIGSVVMWRNYFGTQYAIEDDTLFYMVDYHDGKKAFTFPLTINDADIFKAFKKLDEYCESNNIEKIYCSVHERALPVFKKHYGEISAESDRDWEDYLYNSSDIISFKGRKYCAQRNHINKFKKLYNWSFEEINKTNLNDVRGFFEEFAQNTGKASDFARAELKAVKEVLENFSVYGFFGGIIRVDGNIVAISMGEKSGDTLYVHIEKGNTQYSGVYQIMVNEFASRFADGTRYINREEDCGDEGLRKSKLSYRPVKMLKKYVVKIGR